MGVVSCASRRVHWGEECELVITTGRAELTAALSWSSFDAVAGAKARSGGFREEIILE